MQTVSVTKDREERTTSSKVRSSYGFVLSTYNVSSLVTYVRYVERFFASNRKSTGLGAPLLPLYGENKDYHKRWEVLSQKCMFVAF